MKESLRGVFLPIITPFFDEQVDFDSYTRLLKHYMGKGISGLIPLGTTGEVPTIDEEEFFRIVETTVETVESRVPILVGVSSNSTKKALHLVEALGKCPVQGYLVTSPYYNLPSQQGIYEHFRTLADSTDREIVMYNIPYRTGRNIENDTIFKLSKIPNIAGIKDSCGNIAQTMELLRERDPGFSVLTGEDILFYFNIVNGGSGGILAAAHLQTECFMKTCQLVQQNDHRAALQEWNRISRVIPLLFKEPNPAPVKYVLARKGLIRSEEVRLPLAPISEGLKKTFDTLIDDGTI
ncbi:MAG: 4-hydroxy-tetrahydrodipicolinate synthase [Spirochaetia bacterium]|jgi:4-hydroxy-tetrahydrodipicolinate synthase